MPKRAPRSNAYPSLELAFYNRPVVEVAHDLLGTQLIRQTPLGLCRGRIVEVEAYLARDDSACHAARGPSKKNAAMFGPPGRAYVYMIHSRWCFNVVTEPEGCPSAVLVRALEPLEGIEQMQNRRGTEVLLDIARGPGRLCEALAIDRTFDGWDLTRGDQLWIARDKNGERKRDAKTCLETFPVATSPRIGVTSAQHLQLRFFYRGNRFVSGPRHWHRNESGS